MTSINSPQAFPQIKHRPDIDGLRGVAILLVVFYHAFPEWLPSGFIGVDVFFVISGFLISTIIFQGVAQGNFGFLDFYSRRIRRLLPALIVILICCYAVGWFILLPHEYAQLGKHIAGGTTFISNFILWSEAGYFDNTAITKPLLHLWSLGIEEQFYILWPFILWVGYKSRLNWSWLIILLAIFSLGWNAWLVNSDLIAAFYSPLARAWELLIGAVVAYNKLSGRFEMPSEWRINFFSIAGLCLLVAGIFFINSETKFFGLWALIPTLGTALLITAGPRALFNRFVLSRTFIVWVGLISFPLYLWHWPLLSFARIIEGAPVAIEVRIVLVVMAIALAWLTYVFIEKPFRYGGHSKAKVVFLMAAFATIGYLGLNVYDRDGLPFRGPQVVGKDRGYEGGPGGTLIPSCGLPAAISSHFTCWQDSRDTLRFAMVGDSKATALHGGLVRTSSPNGRWLFIGIGDKGAPLPIISTDPRYAKYQYGSIVAINALAENKDIDVILVATSTRALFQLRNDTDIEDLEASQNYQIVLDGLQRVIDILKRGGKKIVFLIDNPTLPHPEDCSPRITKSDFLNRLLKQTLNQRCYLSLDRHLELSRKYRVLLDELVANNHGNVALFDSIPLLCNQEERLCTTTMNGRLLYGGTDHISDYAAGVIGKEVNMYLQSLQ